MKDIQEAIAQKEKQIEQLRKEIDALGLAEMILKSSGHDTEKPQSQPDMIASILEEVGKPMHVAQIAEQMKRRFHRTVKTTNIGVLLYRYAKRASRFYKVQGKPNTYGLVKWQSVAERAEAIRGESSRALKAAS